MALLSLILPPLMRLQHLHDSNYFNIAYLGNLPLWVKDIVRVAHGHGHGHGHAPRLCTSTLRIWGPRYRLPFHQTSLLIIALGFVS